MEENPAPRGMTQEICEGKNPSTFGTSEKWWLGIFGLTFSVGNLEFLGQFTPDLLRELQLTPQCQESRLQKCVDFFSIRTFRSRPRKERYSKSHNRKGSPCSLRKTSGVCSTQDQVFCWVRKLWRLLPEML